MVKSPTFRPKTGLVEKEQSIQAGFHKTRLAPTPSGYLHLGNIFSFVTTVALARKTGARILLRIDDYDRERVTPHYIQDIFDTLNFLQIPWDEGPTNAREFEEQYAQKHRLHLYHAALQQLIAGGQVFACPCSRTEILQQSHDGCYPGTCRNKGLPLTTPNSALRLKTPETIAMVIKTLSGHSRYSRLPRSVQDCIIRKKDSTPAYQLCSIVDDLHFGVDLVVRGVDLWPSTMAQYYLSTLLGEERFQNATFVHHLVMVDEQGRKMSKSAGGTSVYQFRKEGKRPSDVYTQIARMMGIAEPVADWQSLAASLEEAGVLFSREMDFNHH